MDKNNSKEEAINDIYKVLRPGEPPSFDVANEIFNNLFLNLNVTIFLMLVELN